MYSPLLQHVKPYLSPYLLLPWLIPALLSSVAAWLVSWLLSAQPWTIDLGYALLLLGLNWGFLVLAALFPHRGGRWASPAAGTLLAALKLFVNTFTIFLFIGLQAVRIPLFVASFFSGYLVLQAGGIFLLNRRE